jgi:cellulase (glycosyl hydrolase family 5)/Big-like domain-containing protein/PKD domain-containing protein
MKRWSRGRQLFARSLLTVALILSTLPSSAAASTDLSPLHVDWYRIVDASGRQVTLRGVNRSGTEFACVNEGGFGFSLGPIDQAAVDAIKSWRVNVVRLPLNEQCWLGINGINPLFSGAGYRSAIAGYVNLLNENGLYVILDLHWSAPGEEVATHQQTMPDLDHSVDFWSSVASTFKGNDAVIFEPYNEPLPDNQRDSDAAWTCWRDGGTCPGVAFEAAGMQTLVSAIRATGATNVIALGGVGFANYLSRWLAYKPSDPLNNLVAAWHVYNFNACNNASCWEATAAPLMAAVPVLVTETGMNACDATWWNTFLDWLDARQTGYLAWTWNRWSTDCNSRALVIDYYTATPTEYGSIYRTHLANVPADTTTIVVSSATPSAEGQAVTFTVTVSARGASGAPGGGVAFTIDGTDAGTAALDAAGVAALSRTFDDNGTHSVVARYLGAPGFARSTSGALTQQVTNVSPRVGPLSGAADPVAVGTQLTLLAELSDPGTADTHTARVDWGDGTSAPATVQESLGAGTLTASHAYSAAGVYRVGATVTDDDGAAASAALDAVVVFDPAAGSARGAGWFSSPAGAYLADAALAGRAQFGFLARYQNDGTVPFAQPAFRLRTERFVFESTSYDWLVVTGAKAQLHGTGRVNGSGSYAFLLSAIDGDRLGKDVADVLRIKIWDAANGAVLYDTQVGDPESADPVVRLGGGSIAVGGAP